MATVLGVIPARYGSTRFPGKPLAMIAGKSLIQRVWERVNQCVGHALAAAVVATDDQRIHNHVTAFGGNALMTSTEHASGTDRIGEVAEHMPEFDYYINIQGDEPLIDPAAIAELADSTIRRAAEMSTLASEIDPASGWDLLDNANVVKVVTRLDDMALYFSRRPVPYPRVPDAARYRKHIGIYMYRRDILLRLCKLRPTPLEHAEGLEQLRALEHGIGILVLPTAYDPVSIDVLDDVVRAEMQLRLNDSS